MVGGWGACTVRCTRLAPSGLLHQHCEMQRCGRLTEIGVCTVKGAGGEAVVVVAAADRCVAVALSNEGELQMKEQS